MATLTANRMFVEEGEPCYYIGSSLTNYLEIGRQEETPYYLEARIEGGEYIIDATLLVPGREEPVIISSGRPISEGFDRRITETGYQIIDSAGRVILAAEDMGGFCSIQCTVYDNKGAVIAECIDDCFQVYRGPAIIGKKGNSRGIVLGREMEEDGAG